MVSTMAEPFLGLGFSIFFWILISTSVAADPSLQEFEALHFPSELEQLKSKISFLESKIDERDYELRKKDQIILQLEKIIREKSNKVVTLESEIAFLRQKGPSDSKEHTSKEYTHTRTDELEKQVYGSCRSCFAVLLNHLQTFWHESGRPVANKAFFELLKRKAQVQQWLKIQVEVIVTERIPNLIEQCLVFTTYVKSHVRCWATKTVDMYYEVKNYGVPLALQFFQEWIPNLIEECLVFTTYVKSHVRCWATKTVDMYYIAKNYALAQALQFFQECIRNLPEQRTVVTTFVKPHVRSCATKTVDMYYKVKNYAVPQTLQFFQVHGGWYSRWFADRLSHLQSLWNENGGVVANKAYQKVLESKAQIWQWLGIHP
ncbi:uncharacterized protein LOC111007463 isoform X2 [Momordica charantia]|uniref:Uncharacterized protein LOC111007463 isoform X2 n=1 Tax=Momordica charantia TaxID=3673 RepID=A0A6J1C116_MOMCH|nr:uncharacterized protein LOC111007463 isoform X2 [Momordica charantia]